FGLRQTSSSSGTSHGSEIVGARRYYRSCGHFRNLPKCDKMATPHALQLRHTCTFLEGFARLYVGGRFCSTSFWSADRSSARAKKLTHLAEINQVGLMRKCRWRVLCCDALFSTLRRRKRGVACQCSFHSRHRSRHIDLQEPNEVSHL